VSLILRVARGGLVAALAVAAAGWAVERYRFGSTDQEAAANVENELRQRFDASADALGTIAARAAAARESIAAAPRDTAAVTHLFDVVDTSLAIAPAGRTGVTVYGPNAAPLAWAGHVSDLPIARIDGPAALFVAPGTVGLRLVRTEPLTDGSALLPRLATIAVEQTLATIAGTPAVADTFIVATSLAPATLRLRLRGESPRSPASADTYTFLIPGRGGGTLVDAEVSLRDLAAARARWHHDVEAAVVALLAFTLLLCAGPLIDARRSARDVPGFLRATLGIIATVLVARAILWYATGLLGGIRNIASPIDLLLTALTAAALGWLAIDLIERRRLARPHPPVLRPSGRAAALFSAAFVIAGAIGALLIWVYERILQRVVSHTDVDLLHFSLHPLSGTRFGLACALVLLDAAVIWSAAAMIRVPALVCRPPRTWTWRGLAALGWILGALAATAVFPARGSPIPLGPFWGALATAGVAAILVGRVSGRLRRASQAARLIAFFLALLAPAVAMYPSLFAFATEAKELLVAGEYGPQARHLREDLKLRLEHTLDQIDAMSPQLQEFVSRVGETPTSDRASVVWSKTDLATYHLTSAVELYGADGRLVSRFEILPEYTTPIVTATSCNWEAFDEPAPLGSGTNHVLRASRGICVHGRPIGAVVVRALLDYRTLPFISSQSPYLESVRPSGQARAEGLFGRDVEFVVYGWSRAPIFASGTRVWTLPDRVFDRLAESREPFWETLDRDDQRFRVYFLSDRGGIYALGYPIISWFSHFMNLAELVTLIGVLYLMLLAGASLFSILSLRMPASGRELLREVRSSFYRKLFLAFLAVAILPVAILAAATQRYFAAQLLASVDEAAGRTVAVAQHLVEDYATLQTRGAGAMTAIDDQIMVLVRRAIDEDVNLFDRDRLQATSARDLFASQLLSTRTPGEIYKAIVLERMPTFIGAEEVGDVRYRLAAAPVRAGGREGIVTVPLASRQQEIDEQIDELDRRVLSGAVLFSLLGAAIGYWMAERIADPVNRLTRATRRIARGDLDARIAATSSDELRRLVEDFNQMAADLKHQRAELERTQRVEAWAEMARQVAHDIKNPLTPIQLSAEHARRVNIDRGRPLSPIIDDCVNAILTQVKLLRQISAEFSSFASSPTPRPEPTVLPALIEEVVEPYRTGLAGRVAITVDAPPDLPAISIDRTLFSRALTNVIENALHAMPGGGRLVIAASRTADGSALPAAMGPVPADADRDGHLTVEITDSGIGMDREAVSRIFEPYFSTKATGTGLGLTIAKRNIELNGGTIDVRSQRGVGTTVTITLPI